MSIRILLADDHALVRQGVRSLLEMQPAFVVVGDCSNGLEAVKLIEELKPDVVLLDLMMPGLSGLEVTRRVSGITHVLILTMHANEGYVIESLRCGAYGYILKEATAVELVHAVETVSTGKRYLGEPFSELSINAYLDRRQDSLLNPYDTLTQREREVLQLIAEGNSSNEVAERLSISPRTVEVHRANLMRKLNLRTQTDLIRFALRSGILPLDG